MSSSSDIPELPALPDVHVGAPIATNADQDPYIDDDGKPWIGVAVGELTGHYSVHLHKVVASDGRVYTPTGFECAGGKNCNRKWRLSLRVLLPNGQRGRTLGHWLMSRGLDHLVPQPTPRRVPGGSRTGSASRFRSGSGDLPDTSAPPSARASPEKRQRPPEEASPDGSPTKQLRKAFGAATLGAGPAAGSPPPMPCPSAPDSPPVSKVIGAFMEQPLAAAAAAGGAASRRGFFSDGPLAPGQKTPTLVLSGSAADQKTPTLFPPGVEPRQFTPAEALALEELHRGMTVILHPPVISGGASGAPVFTGRVLGGDRHGDEAMLTPPMPHEETALGAPRARPRHPTPIPSAAEVAAALAHSHRAYGIAAPGAAEASPEQSIGVRLPPRRSSGSSLELAHVFDYNCEDGQRSPGGGGAATGAAGVIAAFGHIASPALGSSPRDGGVRARTEASADWDAGASITLALGGPLQDLAAGGGTGSGGGLAGVFGAGQDPKHSDGSSLSNARSALKPLRHEEMGFLPPGGDAVVRGAGLTDKAAVAALGLPLVADATRTVMQPDEEAAKAASIGSSSIADKEPGGSGGAGPSRLGPL